MNNMTRDEILQAIDETIVPNNKKAITADSMANILRELASASGGASGGTGDGALKINICIPDFLSDVELDSWSPEVLEAMVDEMEMELPGVRESTFYTKCMEGFQKNAEVYQIIRQKALQNEGVLILADISIFMGEYYKIMFGTYEEVLGFPLFENIGASVCDVLISSCIVGDPTQEAIDSGYSELFGGQFMIAFMSCSGQLVADKMIILLEDGSVQFMSMYLKAPELKIFIPEQVGGTLTEDKVAENAAFFQKCWDYVDQSHVIPTNIDIVFTSGSYLLTYQYNRSFLEVYIQEDYFEGTFLRGTTVYKVRIEASGATTITEVGSITSV